MDSLLFTPVTLGPLTLRNRSIRSAAFESMCPGNVPSPQLLDYHRSVAAGGVGMTTVAYAAVTRSGLSFDRQLWMSPEIVPGLRELTDAVQAPRFLFYRKQFAFDSFIIPDTKNFSSRFFAKEKRCRNLLTPQYLSIFSLKNSAHKGFFVQ